jgi:phosphoribosylformimino-5-aminoimidazole carboxamide ribotide isomerase
MSAASPFEILPAIDLRGGRVVRLQEGDFERETVFSDNPMAVAVAFAAAGARWLHVVDLDGARTGVPAHRPAIAAMVEAVGKRTQIEVAGGLRNEQSVADALRAGAARAVVGTAAIEDPVFAGRLVAAHGSGRIAVAIDIRDGVAVGRGWMPGAPGIDPVGAIRRLADAGVETFEVTAIDRDGLLAGPDFDLYQRLIGLGRGSMIASGGIAAANHLQALREIGCAGAILGRALYEGHIDLAAALRSFHMDDAPRPPDPPLVEAFFQKVRAVCPSFVSIDDAELDDWNDDGGPPPYIRVGALARYLSQLAGNGQLELGLPVLDAVERVIVGGDASMHDLMVVGLLEDLQNYCLQSDGRIPLVDVRARLGPGSTAAWDELMTFWHGPPDETRRLLPPGSLHDHP